MWRSRRPKSPCSAIASWGWSILLNCPKQPSETSGKTLGWRWGSKGLKAIFLATTVFRLTTLWMPILADAGAIVLVTANALRLRRHGRSQQAHQARIGRLNLASTQASWIDALC